MSTLTASPFESGDEPRLNEFGLSIEIFHNALRPGASRAANRSALALPSSPGTDVYHDGMEQLAQILYPAGWRLVLVDRQPRLLHPDRSMSFAISSAVNVGKANMRTPRTNQKGPATRNSLAAPDPQQGLFDGQDAELSAELVAAAEKAPFYFLLCERARVGGSGLILEFSRPAGMTERGSVNEWAERIAVDFLDIEGDLSVFDSPADDDLDVPVEPR